MLLSTTEGAVQFPADFPRWTLVFYYGGDFSPVSATELMALAQMKHTFEKKQCDLLCISADRIASHLAFIKTLNRYRPRGSRTTRCGLRPARWYRKRSAVYRLAVGNGGRGAVCVPPALR